MDQICIQIKFCPLISLYIPFNVTVHNCRAIALHKLIFFELMSARNREDEISIKTLQKPSTEDSPSS